MHLGNAGCAEDRLRRDVAEIADDPRAFWLGGGDYADLIGYSDGRFDPANLADWVKAKDLGDLGAVAMRRAREILAPIADKCLGLIIGNHEYKYQLKQTHEGLHGWLCTELGAPNLGYCCLFDLVLIRLRGVKKPYLSPERPKNADNGHSETFRVFCHHGAGYAQTPGGKLNRLVQFMQSFEADVYFAGHVHDQVGRREPTIGADDICTTIRAHERIGVVSGSYLRTYAQDVTTYGERAGYRPTTLGAAWVRIKPDGRQMRGAI